MCRKAERHVPGRDAAPLDGSSKDTHQVSRCIPSMSRIETGQDGSLKEASTASLQDPWKRQPELAHACPSRAHVGPRFGGRPKDTSLGVMQRRSMTARAARGTCTRIPMHSKRVTDLDRSGWKLERSLYRIASRSPKKAAETCSHLP